MKTQILITVIATLFYSCTNSSKKVDSSTNSKFTRLEQDRNDSIAKLKEFQDSIALTKRFERAKG